MNDEVLEFIERRWKGKNSSFLNENCYWFARILKARFFYLKIYYLPVEGHFVAGYNNIYYDANGVVETSNPIISLDEIRRTDYSWYDRLMRDCRD